MKKVVGFAFLLTTTIAIIGFIIAFIILMPEEYAIMFSAGIGWMVILLITLRALTNSYKAIKVTIRGFQATAPKENT